MSLLSELRNWRNNQARIEGVEQYRVLSNATLEALVGALPETKEAMLQVKGIKEAKFGKYGKTLLALIAGAGVGGRSEKKRENEKSVNDEFFQALGGVSQEEQVVPEEKTLSVSEFLDGLNIELSGMAARVQGEVSSVDVRERVVYFTLKDGRDESMLPCLIFLNQYTLSGVDLAIGDEIIVEGAPDIYKPNGRLSLRVGMIELCGEGALKKAYDALKLKLEAEGVFAPEKKRVLPEFPTRIALITSEQGAAIGDFTMNLGAQGLHVGFYPTSVEGKKAVFEIIEALRYFSKRAEEYDILVLIRGGGSFESLQAFNNEALVRAVAECPLPTLLGVGHEKDITLAALAADTMVSTPTATARTLRAPWDEARGLVRHFETHLPMLMERELTLVRTELGTAGEALLYKLGEFLKYAEALKQLLSERLLLLQGAVREHLMSLSQAKKILEQGFLVGMEKAKKELSFAENLLRQYDPTRVLKLGYSLVKSGGRIIRDGTALRTGDRLDIELARGRLGVVVAEILDK